MEIIQNEQQNTQPVLPKPTVSGTFGHGWETMKKNIPELLVVLLIQALLALPAGLGKHFVPDDLAGAMSYNVFNFIYGLLVLAPVSFGCSWVYLKAVRGEAFQVQDIFFAYQSFGQVLIANILLGLIIVAGIIMLVVPGIIFACRLVFVPYLVMDEKLEATEAIRRSWHMTRGHAGTIFLMAVTSFFVVIGGVICLVVGVIPAIIWISLAFATMYWVVSTRLKQEKSNP